MSAERYCVNEPSVISEIVDGETIVLNFESGHYYSFHASATEIWRCVRAGLPVGAVADGVARRFAVDPAAIRPAVAAFVGRLVDEKLVRPAPGEAVPPLSAEPDERPLEPFAAPAFEKFTDMEEMLLLDPIHEVGDAGWPRKPDRA